jgi:DNA-binding GntR family transcriptional regulator
MGDELKLDRSLLKDMAADMLRDQISSGRIPEGTKLTEREVSRLLGISRMPVRDALLVLEAEGLVVSRPDGRYVIELTEKDVRDIHRLRETLECLAAELAAGQIDDENRAQLWAAVAALEKAVASDDPAACTRADMALHRAIWRQADNPHLLRVLDAVLGAVFVLAERIKLYGDPDQCAMVADHRELVAAIAAGDAAAASETLQRQLRSALEHSLRTYRAVQRAAGAAER